MIHRETLEHNVHKIDDQDARDILARERQSRCSFPAQTCHLEYDSWDCCVGAKELFSHGFMEEQTKIVDRMIALHSIPIH